MSAPKRLLIAFLVVLPGLWLATGQIFQAPAEIFAIRPAMMQGTGILAIGAMSLALVLAMRPVRLEGLLGELERSLRVAISVGLVGLAIGILGALLVFGARVLGGGQIRDDQGGVGTGGHESDHRQGERASGQEFFEVMEVHRFVSPIATMKATVPPVYVDFAIVPSLFE